MPDYPGICQIHPEKCPTTPENARLPRNLSETRPANPYPYWLCRSLQTSLQTGFTNKDKYLYKGAKQPPVDNFRARRFNPTPAALRPPREGNKCAPSARDQTQQTPHPDDGRRALRAGWLATASDKTRLYRKANHLKRSFHASRRHHHHSVACPHRRHDPATPTAHPSAYGRAKAPQTIGHHCAPQCRGLRRSGRPYGPSRPPKTDAKPRPARPYGPHRPG